MTPLAAAALVVGGVISVVMLGLYAAYQVSRWQCRRMGHRWQSMPFGFCCVRCGAQLTEGE